MLAGIADERINAGEVLMVEGVQEGRTEFKCGSFADFESLDYSNTSDVGDGILRQVARHVAEWRAEERL